MRVHVARAQSEQMFLLDESQDLVIVRHDNPIQLLQKPQHDGARLQIADRQFADNEGMCRNLFSNEQISQYVIVPARWSIHTEVSTSITQPSIGDGAQASDEVANRPTWPTGVRLHAGPRPEAPHAPERTFH
ncbi:MAG TPA: hypothetical protein VMQ99_04015 [Acetobacteraceae bacterium]|jgi:hypothetical protein|nr:hypothetical protein [Acetobacteraceae bacterium]